MSVLYKVVSFGSSKAGLSTVGFRLYDPAGNPAYGRTTAGVSDLGGGQYGAAVGIPSGFRGFITWDTGEASPAYASASVNPEDGETLNAVLAKVSVAAPGATPVDHDFGGTDELRYVDPSGASIPGAVIQVYTREDYDAGRRSNAFVAGRTDTGTDGRWLQPVMLTPGDYVVILYRQGLFGPTRVDITVE